MTEQERALRIAHCFEHHLAYGIRIEDDKERAKAFLNDTAPIPITLFHASLRRARQTHEGNFPPTAGQVIHQARALEWERDPNRYRSIQNGQMASPIWYRRMLRGSPPMYLELAPGEPIKEIA